MFSNLFSPVLYWLQSFRSPLLQAAVLFLAVIATPHDLAAVTIVVSPSATPATPDTAYTLIAGTAVKAYSQTFSATGGTTVSYTYSLTNSNLPSTLTLNGAVLSGTPTTSGTYTFTITATDGNSYSGSQVYTLTINPALQTDFALSAPNPASQTIVSGIGGTATYAFGFTPAGTTYPCAMTFTAAGAPAPSSYQLTVTPSSLAAGAGAQTITMKFGPTTTAATSATHSGGSFDLSTAALAFLLLPLGMLCRGRKLLSNKPLGCLLVLITGAAVLGASGCNKSRGIGGDPQAPQTYTFTLTATSACGPTATSNATLTIMRMGY
jgi:hypothetical protein